MGKNKFLNDLLTCSNVTFPKGCQRCSEICLRFWVNGFCSFFLTVFFLTKFDSDCFPKICFSPMLVYETGITIIL